MIIQFFGYMLDIIVQAINQLLSLEVSEGVGFFSVCVGFVFLNIVVQNIVR